MICRIAASLLVVFAILAMIGCERNDGTDGQRGIERAATSQINPLQELRKEMAQLRKENEELKCKLTEETGGPLSLLNAKRNELKLITDNDHLIDILTNTNSRLQSISESDESTYRQAERRREFVTELARRLQTLQDVRIEYEIDQWVKVDDMTFTTYFMKATVWPSKGNPKGFRIVDTAGRGDPEPRWWIRVRLPSRDVYNHIKKGDILVARGKPVPIPKRWFHSEVRQRRLWLPMNAFGDKPSMHDGVQNWALQGEILWNGKEALLWAY